MFSFFAPSYLAGSGLFSAIGGDFHLFGGFAAFIQTPVFAIEELVEAQLPEAPGEELPHPIFLFLIMMTARIANFTVFTRLPFGVALIAILLPWPAYIYLFSTLAGFLPFYPWAIGIALIHIGRFPKPEIERRPIYDRILIQRYSFTFEMRQ